MRGVSVIPRPVFVKKIILTYKFESIQHLRFVVYDADEDANVNTVILCIIIHS